MGLALPRPLRPAWAALRGPMHHRLARKHRAPRVPQAVQRAVISVAPVPLLPHPAVLVAVQALIPVPDLKLVAPHAQQLVLLVLF